MSSAVDTIAVATLVWNIVTMVLNAMLRTRTAEEWVRFCEDQPRLAGFVRMIRGVGVDPVKGFQGLMEMLQTKGDRP